MKLVTLLLAKYPAIPECKSNLIHYAIDLPEQGLLTKH